MNRRLRSGIILLPVLAVMATVSASAALLAERASVALGGSRNRIALTKAYWAAHGCFESIRGAAFDAMLSADARFSGNTATDVWISLDTIALEAVRWHRDRCQVAIRAAGAVPSISTFDQAVWGHALQMHIGAAKADSVVAAVADWVDADDEPRPLGAEREWYLVRELVPPTNQVLQHPEELSLVRGAAALDLDLSDDTTFRVPLGYASPFALSTLPGASPEVLERLSFLRQRSRVIALAELVNGVPGAAGDTLRNHYETWRQRTTPIPDAWQVSIQGFQGSPRLVVRLDATITRIGERGLSVSEWRVW